MPKFSDSFIEPYPVGPLSPTLIDEMEREKKRRLREHLNTKKRAKKIESLNQDRAPELSDQMIADAESPVPMASKVTNMTPQPRDMMPETQNMMPMPSSQSGLMSYGSQPEYNLGQNERDSIKESPSAFRGSLPPQGDKLDSRKMLMDYLTQRRESEPQFQEDYRDLSRQAETGRVLNTFASGLGEMASMAGTLGGKRADTGDLKALPNAIYGAQRREADESLALRRLANQEQVSDIRLLRDLERGDLDALRTQKILADLNRQKQVPKTLPYFVPGDGQNPPKMVMMRNDGTVEYKDLPAGARPTAESYTLGQPVMQGGQVIYPQTSKGGDVRFVKGPEGSKTYEQMRIENQDEANKADRRLREIEFERKEANDAHRKQLDREELNLRKSISEWEKKRDQQKIDIDEQKLNKGTVKKLSPSDISKLNEAKNSEQVINDLDKIIDKYSSIMGPIEGTIKSSSLVKPFNEKARLFDADIRRVRQVIGKLTEGGVLRKEDEAKYLEMLPNMSDTPKVAHYKARQFGDMLKRDYQSHIKILKEQGYDISGLETSQPSTRKPLGQMTREEKLRELEEHKAGGR